MGIAREEERGGLVSRFAEYSRYGKSFEKAVDTVLQGSVKKHVFRPSGRLVYSVVGNTGDELVDPAKGFCSCSNYFFRVLGGHDETCYHLLSLKIAIQTGIIDEVDFDDEEYGQFVRFLFLDILNAETLQSARVKTQSYG